MHESSMASIGAGSPPSAISRTGGALLVAAVVLAVGVAAIGLSGRSIGLGGPEVAGWLVAACVAVLGLGAALVALDGGVMAGAWAPRISLGILALGGLSVAGWSVVSATLAGDPFESTPATLLLLGGLAVPVGVALVGLTFALRPAPVRLPGLAILLGCALIAASRFGPPEAQVLALVGVLGLAVGFAWIGLQALGIGRSALR